MPVIEPKESGDRERDIVTPIILIVLLILLLGGGGLIFWMARAPTSKVVKLKDSASDSGAYSNNDGGAMPNWPQKPFDQAANPEPIRVSLDLKNATLSQALAALSSQSGVEVKIADARQQPGGSRLGRLLGLAGIGATSQATTTSAQQISLTVSQVPFWDALHQICAQSHYWPVAAQSTPNTVTLESDARNLNVIPATSIGSCQVVPTQVMSAFNIAPSNPQAYEPNLEVSLMLLCEPKLAIYHISSVATVEEAVDEHGASLLRPRESWDERNHSNQSGQSISTVTCMLNYPKSNPGDRIARLKGYASVFLSDKEQTIRIMKPLTVKNKDTEVDGQMIRFGGMHKSGPRQFVAYFYAPSSYPAFADWQLLNHAAELLDSTGKKLQHEGDGINGDRNGVFEFSLYFGGDVTGDPSELDIVVPNKLREIRVPFEFHDLPLPH